MLIEGESGSGKEIVAQAIHAASPRGKKPLHIVNCGAIPENLVESVLQHMSDSLASGEAVKISSFGTFSVRAKTARVGRNPKTGEEVPILPRRVLTFRPSHLMKDRVAAGKKR